MEFKSRDVLSAFKANPRDFIIVLLIACGLWVGREVVHDIGFVQLKSGEAISALHESTEKLNIRFDSAETTRSNQNERFIAVLDRIDRRLQADCLNRAETREESVRCATTEQ